MKIAPFRLERYFAQYEFNTRYLLCSSDCESISTAELLDMQPGSREELERLWLGYTESQGSPALREEIARLYHDIDPSQILVHTGAEEAIFLFLNAVLEPDDHVIIHWPCYQSLYEVARSIGCQITLWPGEPASNWRLDMQFLEDNIQANTRAVVVNCPHNPTGYLMERGDWDDLNHIAEQHELIVFSDEVYSGLEYDPGDRLPPFCELNENAVSLNVLSKSYGLAGLRLGWIATHNAEVYQKMAALKDYTTICGSAPSELLGIQALRSRERIVGRNREIIARNLPLLNDFFARHADLFNWSPPKAGPIAFPSLRDGSSAADFCRKLVESAQVLLLPGDLYAPEYRSHFRIGFGRANLPDALEAVERFLKHEGH